MPVPNLLIIMDDEHNKKVLGYNGHPRVRTPNLDRLARGGTVFANAYSSSPICVPARAAFATGRHVHATRCWDNAIAYDGSPRGWAHHLRDSGHTVVSIGKLHYVNGEVDSGFSEQIIPMHIEAGVGDLHGLLRDPLPRRHQSADLARSIGPGDSSYIRYDRDITQRSVDWLHARAGQRQDKPWVLFCSFIAPHSPLIAPPEFYAMYPPEQVALSTTRVVHHPWIRAWNDCYGFDAYFESDAQRRVAVASYFGLCTFLDHNVGRIMAALEDSGQAASTRVLFLSDHGDNLGARALWGKSTMYEESAGIPMLTWGAGVSAGLRVDTPVSHVDCQPFILGTLGVQDPDGPALPGRSLTDIAAEPVDPRRTVFSEYHAAGGVSAVYMLRRDRWKYIHYTGFAPELFDLRDDPDEVHDLAGHATWQPLLRDFERDLRAICEPEAIDQQAKRDQERLIAVHGGAQAILERGGCSYSPIPGEASRLYRAPGL